MFECINLMVHICLSFSVPQMDEIKFIHICLNNQITWVLERMLRLALFLHAPDAELLESFWRWKPSGELLGIHSLRRVSIFQLSAGLHCKTSITIQFAQSHHSLQPCNWGDPHAKICELCTSYNGALRASRTAEWSLNFLHFLCKFNCSPISAFPKCATRPRIAPTSNNMSSSLHKISRSQTLSANSLSNNWLLHNPHHAMIRLVMNPESPKASLTSLPP